MSFQARICTGDGVVARYGGTLVVAPSDSPVVDGADDLARAADRDSPGAPGKSLSRKIAGLVSQADDTPDLAIVAALEDGLAVLLVGNVTMTLTDDTGTTVQSGTDATTWVDRIVRAPWTSLVITLPGAGAVEARSDLQGGVLTAAGVELVPAGVTAVAAPAVPVAPAAPAPVAAPTPPSTPAQAAPEAPAPVPPAPEIEPPAVAAPEPDAAPVPAFESFSLLDASDPAEAEPLPVAGGNGRSTAQVSAGDLQTVQDDVVNDGAVMVQGIECSRQHFNDPTSIYCAVCGISMVHQTHNLVSGTRPPLGVIVLDDGAVFTLNGDYVLGREPENAPEVLAGTAAPLALDDPDVTMSRVHAKVVLVGWDVNLVDAGSANGSYTAKPGEAEWTRVPTGEAIILKPGTKVSLGGRSFVFDSHHKL